MSLLEEAGAISISLDDVLASLNSEPSSTGLPPKPKPVVASRLGEVQSESLGPLLLATEIFCEAHSMHLAPRRAVKYVIDQRSYLEQLSTAVVEVCKSAVLKAGRVICLGGVGVTALTARRVLPPGVKVVSVQPIPGHSKNEELAWQRRLVQVIAHANQCPNVECSVALPRAPWSLLVVEGLDSFALSDGMLPLLRSAASHAAPDARVLPAGCRICAELVAPRGYTTVAEQNGRGYDLTAVCGEQVLAATAPLLMLEGETALLEGAKSLTDPFQALPLWEALHISPVMALAELPDSADTVVNVTCTGQGTCAAIVFWWEAAISPTEWCRSGIKCIQWLSKPRGVEVGEQLQIKVSRSLTRVHFELEGCTGVGPSQLQDISFAALRHVPMLRDDVRNHCYSMAIQGAVQRAKVMHSEVSVLEIGSGFGLLMMMAKRAGADRVTGIEVDKHVCELAGRVVADNGMPFGGAGSDFELIPKSFQAVCQDPDFSGKFNVLVAELLDDSGLGENIWPFFAAARQRLLTQKDAVIVPRRLTIYAALVAIELAPICGTNFWPLDPFFFGAALPNTNGVARHSGTQIPGLELDRLEEHWHPVSDVVEVLSIDLASGRPEDCQPGAVDVHFTAAADGIMNGVVWFWHAELDDEHALATTPNRFWNKCGHTVLPSAQKPSAFHWKQACQLLGPTWIQSGQLLRVRAFHSTTSIEWGLEDVGPGQQVLLQYWEQCRRLTGEAFLAINEITKSWFRAASLENQAAALTQLTQLWSRERFSTEAQVELLSLLGRLGDFGLHPAAANVALPHFFGSLTAGSYRVAQSDANQ